ncbi:MAG: hypothetical protein ACXWP4_22440 [Polyangiales bacterium]
MSFARIRAWGTPRVDELAREIGDEIAAEERSRLAPFATVKKH